MLLDPERVAEVSDWLSNARDALRAGEHLMGATPPLLGTALYHAQQTVEAAVRPS